MSHPDVDDLHRVVLILSNRQRADRLFIEVPNGSTETSIEANMAVKRLDIGWFSQAWFAEEGPRSKDGKIAYTLRNIRSGTYLQSGPQRPDGSAELTMGARVSGTSGKRQMWYISNDHSWARIANAQTKQVVELLDAVDGSNAKIVLRNNDSENKETQVWAYERVSRSAADISAALKASNHMPKDPNKAVAEYQSTDPCYIVLPPQVRQQIWKDSGLGRGRFVWRKEIFDCDDFAFACKAAVSRWAAENLEGEEFTILFGVTFGETRASGEMQRHAYNWYLDWNDLKSVVFFEPQTGDESDDGWNYKGFNGIF